MSTLILPLKRRWFEQIRDDKKPLEFRHLHAMSSMIHFLSICSGIEAASAAWGPLGWQAVGFSEIDPFACAVLAHHHPRVPNFGSLTDFRQWPVDALAQADVLVGGTPCQAFSVAGLRQSLADERGNLTLTLVHLYDHLTEIRHTAGRPAPVLVWENVPGVLNTPDNAFGCFLGGLAGEDGLLRPPGGAWHDAGYVRGPQRTIAWRVLDAQYQGLAQRRRRVFLVAGPRDGFCAEQVLFEFTGLRRDTPPRREAGQSTAPTLAARTRGGGGLGTDAECDGAVIAETLRGQAESSQQADKETFVPELSYAIQAGAGGSKFGSGRHNQDTFIPEVCAPLTTNHHADHESQESKLIPIAFPQRMSSTQCASTQCASTEDLSPSLQSLNPTAIAFPELDSLQNKGITRNACSQETNACQILRNLLQEIGEKTFTKWGLGILNSLQSPEVLQHALHGSSIRPAAFSRSWVVHCTLSRSQNNTAWLVQSLREAECQRCASQGWQPPEQLARELGAYLSELSQPGAQAARFMSDLWSASQRSGLLRQTLSKIQEVGESPCKKNKSAHAGYAVRRLTCEECEFLQGFPRGYTLIPWRGKPADLCPDGPRYKALGNSMAVPVMHWIGARLCAYLCQ